MVKVLLAATGVLALAACSSPGSVPTGGPSATGPATSTSGAPTPLSPTETAPASDPPTAPTGGTKTAVLRATTNGPASITYTDGGSEVREEISRSWEKTIDLTNLPADVSLTIVSDRANSDVGCEIEADGVHVQNASSGGSVDATCSTKIS